MYKKYSNKEINSLKSKCKNKSSKKKWINGQKIKAELKDNKKEEHNQQELSLNKSESSIINPKNFKKMLM